jgi:hypothetical protein
MTKTKGCVILEKYNSLLHITKENISENLFPPPEEISVVDIVYIMQTYFLPYYEEQNYEVPIKLGMYLKQIQISDDSFNDIYVEVKDIIHSLLSIIKDL